MRPMYQNATFVLVSPCIVTLKLMSGSKIFGRTPNQAKKNFQKLIPCGSVSDVMPWLARRVQENSDAAQRTKVERRLIRKELSQRTFVGPKRASVGI